jgi:hypothetical protein
MYVESIGHGLQPMVHAADHDTTLVKSEINNAKNGSMYVEY